MLDERGTELDSQGIAQLIAKARRFPLGALFLWSELESLYSFFCL